MENSYARLKKILTEVIKEMQIKVGKLSVPTNFYYPLKNLNRFFGKEYLVQEMREILDGFKVYVKDDLGEIEIEETDGRFCFKLGKTAIEYANGEIIRNGFLKEFIDLMSGNNPVTVKDVEAVFNRYSKSVKIEKSNDEEFDYCLYFLDGYPDEFIYLIKIEDGYKHYHRFTKEDFEALFYKL